MDVLEQDRYSAPTNKLQILTAVDNQTFTIVSYKGIFDSQYGIRLAVVGAQWSLSFLEELFANFTRNASSWAVCQQVRYPFFVSINKLPGCRYERRQVSLLEQKKARHDDGILTKLTVV